MGQGDSSALTIQALQASPLIKQYFPAGLEAGLLQPHLRDPALLYQDLDALCAMSQEELRVLVRPAAGEEEAPASPDLEEAPQDEEAPTPQTPFECVLVKADPDGLVARLRLLEPPEDVAQPGRREMLRALFQQKITTGVKLEFIARLAERPLYGRLFRIAEGRPPVNGQDGGTVFHFDPSTDLRPQTLEDGTVDYRALDFVKSVQAGELLCELVPPTAGTDGADIFGRTVPAAPGRPTPTRCGANTTLSDDGREIRAACDGQVFLQGDTVVVSQFLTLDAVDFSTGNIDFPGSVHIRGDVANGFTVKAGGDIVVSGVVENATLISGGSIALCSGVKGGGNGFLEARQDIRTLFIESCRAKAGGSIFADSILNSFLECGRQVSVLGKRGCLLGGVCVAGESVCAVQIGNQANIPTAVTVSAAAGLSGPERQSLAAVERCGDAADRLSRLAEEDARAPAPDFSQELARIAVLTLRLEHRAEQLLSKAGRPSQAGRRMVQVLESLYPNVSMEIDGVSAKNTGLRTRCTVTRRGGKLYFTNDRP